VGEWGCGRKRNDQSIFFLKILMDTLCHYENMTLSQYTLKKNENAFQEAIYMWIAFLRP